MLCLLHESGFAQVGILSQIWMDLQKTAVIIGIEVKVHFLHLRWAPTNVLRQTDNEHALQCAETDCLWQFSTHRHLHSVPDWSLSTVLCKIIFWKVELHTNFGIRHTVQSGSKLI